MCTVSFIPVNDTWYITSNRDEKYSRKNALPPTVYDMPGGKLIFPRDADAGGSWIALHESGNAAVLLNGAFEKHIAEPPYRRSRGLIFLDVISHHSPARKFDTIDLSRIEPFTLIIVDSGNLYECRWDGRVRHCRQLRKHRHGIWSSSTLYEKDMTRKRERAFAAFLNKNPFPNQEAILQFHQFNKMDENETYTTVSITSIVLKEEYSSMTYIDQKEMKRYDQKIITSAVLY